MEKGDKLGDVLSSVGIFGLLPKTDFKTNKQKKKKTTGCKGRNAKINKLDLKTNETFMTQFTNALFYKVDKNRLQVVTCISVPMQELIH